MNRFLLHFTSAYGTLWAVVVLAAVLTQSHINTGMFGLLGFPVIALVYGLVRMKVRQQSDNELQRENKRLKQLLEMYERGENLAHRQAGPRASVRIFEELEEFIRRNAFTGDRSLERSTRLYADLKLTGDAAEDLLLAYAEHFRVDLSAFDFSDHFIHEEALVFGNGGKKDLSLGDLERGIRAGKLDKTVLEGK